MKKFELTENFKVNAFGVKLFQIDAYTGIKSKIITEYERN